MVLSSAAQRLDESAPEFGVREAALAGQQVLADLDHARVIELVVEEVPELADGGPAIDPANLVRQATLPPSRPS